MPATSAADLRIAVMRLARRLRTERSSDDLTPSQMAVLATLMRNGPTSTGQLAASERIRPPSMTRILNSLRTRGLVTRTAHPHDRRLVSYEVTPQAREMVQQDRQQRDQWLNRRLETLSPAERQTLQDAIPVLTKLALD